MSFYEGKKSPTPYSGEQREVREVGFERYSMGLGSSGGDRADKGEPDITSGVSTSHMYTLVCYTYRKCDNAALLRYSWCVLHPYFLQGSHTICPCPPLAPNDQMRPCECTPLLRSKWPRNNLQPPRRHCRHFYISLPMIHSVHSCKSDDGLYMGTREDPGDPRPLQRGRDSSLPRAGGNFSESEGEQYLLGALREPTDEQWNP